MLRGCVSTDTTLVAIEAGMELVVTGINKDGYFIVHCTNLPKLVDGHTSLFLLLDD